MKSWILRSSILLLPLAGLLLLAAQPQTDRQKLRGTWHLVSGEQAGEQISTEDFLVAFEGDQCAIQKSKDDTDRGTFKLDSAKKPKAIDLVIGGKTAKGIYQLEGDSLKLCIAQPEQDRPTEFSTPRGTKTILLVLKRGEQKPSAKTVSARPNRPQEPKRPYPYDDEEVVIENKQAGIKLAGTLFLPRTKGPVPAVILVTGSGPHDRYETHATHKPFLVLGDYLVRRGIAVLLVDDRGVNKSGGVHSTATSEDFATDALAGVEYLKTRKEINPRWIGLAGHSEGGVITPLAAGKSKDVGFLIIMAGPGVPMEQVLANQSAALTERRGGSPEAVSAARSTLRQLSEVLKKTKGDVSEEQLRGIVADAAVGVPDKEKMDTISDFGRSGRGFRSPWFRFILEYDPKSTFAKVQCPVLAINGGYDLFVSPKDNLQGIEQALKAGGNKDYTIKELPGLNHMFQASKRENDQRLEETMSPVAMETMASWILSRTVERK